MRRRLIKHDRLHEIALSAFGDKTFRPCDLFTRPETLDATIGDLNAMHDHGLLLRCGYGRYKAIKKTPDDESGAKHKEDNNVNKSPT